MRATSTNTSVLDEIDQADIERIEIITGPASALYGSGAFGGTISVFTQQPPRDFKARLSQELGSWDFQRTKGYVGGTLADGRVGFVMSGSTMENDGWRKNTAPSNNDPAAEKKHGGTLRTQIRPTDTTKITLGYSENYYDYRWAGPIPLNATEAAKLKNITQNGVNLRSVHFDNDWRQTVPGTYGQYIDESRTASFRLQQMLGERGEFTLAHTRIANDSINNGNGGSGGANSVICDWTGAATPGKVRCQDVNFGAATVTNTVKQTDTVTKTTVGMYRHDFDFAKTTTYVGAEMIDVETDATTWNNAYSALQGQSGHWTKGSMTATGQGSFSDQRETTPFFHVEFSPLDKLRLHVGKRFSRIAYDVDDRKATNKDVTASVRGNVLRTGLTYDLVPGHILWASRGETFNPQAATTLVDSAAKGTARNAIGATLNPEEGTTHEIGFRGLFSRLGLRYDLTFFHARNQGYIASRDCTAAEQAALNAGAACTLSENIGSIETKGIESMFSWAATSWLDLGATYTNARVYFREYENASVNYTGNDYQSAPRQKLNLRIGFKPAPGWLIELEGDHLSKYFVNNANDRGTYQRPDLFSLRTSYRSKDWSLWLHAINLTNEKYATRAMVSTVGGNSSVLVAQAGQGNAGSYTPLMLRLGASYQF
jgi:outer membrane receptor protein involved in Fe transport